MLIFVDKPTGWTSFDVVKKVKNIVWEKAGHCGTLDPLATGLMIVATWKDTKKLTELTWLDKSYIATIDFSQKSDTRDIDYDVYYEKLDIEFFELEKLKNILDSYIPAANLQVPSYSAKKVKWKKLYDEARAWNHIEMFRDMKIYWYEILDYSFPVLKIKLDVWSWTYIRSIAYDIWKKLQVGGILTSLRRTKIWDFDIEKENLFELKSSKD